MNVCLATRFTGGVGVYARTLAKALLITDPTMHLRLVSPDSIDVPADLAPRVSAHPIRYLSGLPTHPGWVAVALAFRRAIEPLIGSVDVVHVTDARHTLFSTGLAVPMIGTMNDYFYAVTGWNPGSVRRYYQDWLARYPLYQLARLGERRALRGLSHIIGISDAVGQTVGPAYGIPLDRFTTVRYGIDFSAIPPNHGIVRSPRTVLFVGGNFQRKGLLVLLSAAPAVLRQFPDTRFLIVGKSNYARGCEQRGARPGYRGAV